MKTNAKIAACALALALALVGCGGGGNADGGSTDGGQTEGIQTVAEGKLTVASDMAYPSMESIPEGSDQPEGFEIDLVKALAERIGLEAEFLPPVKFDTIIPMIKQGGRADIGAASFTITDERALEIDFTEPFMDSNQSIVTLADSPVQAAADLNADGIQVAVQAGTTGEAWVRENLPNATCVTLDDAIQALTGCQTGLYDAVVADLPVMAYLCTSSYTDLRVAVEIPTGEQYGIVVSKDNPELLAALNEALAEMQADGSYDELYAQWFGA